MNLSITLIIVAINVIVSLSAFNNQILKEQLIFSPYIVKHKKEWWRFITHAFIHADYLHLFFNMYVLYNFGELIENTLIYLYGNTSGSLYYIAMYLGGILFATIPSMRKHSDNIYYKSLGASGAVSSVLFAFIIFYPLQKLSLLFIPIGIPAFIFGALYIAFETYSNKKGRTNIAHDAHIAGAIFGVLYVCAIDINNLSRFIDKIGL